MDGNLLRFNLVKKSTIFDMETYNLGLSFEINKPWQLGLLNVVGQEINETHDILIKWPNPPRFNSLMVNQIFKTTVKELESRIEQRGVAPEKAFEALDKSFENSELLIGHNILGFDCYLVKEFYKLMGKPWKHLLPKFVDTNCLAKAVKIPIKYQPGESLIEFQYRLLHFRQKGLKTKLEILGKEFGIEHDYEHLHDAFSDISLNLKVWEQLKFRIEL
jgi:DNA polymerase III epsilon subunit-like protein